MTDFHGEYDEFYERGENIIRNTPGRVAVFVESEADVPFWYRIFKKFAPGLNIEIEASVRLETRKNEDDIEGSEANKEERERNARGKDIVLQLKDTVGQHRLLCVDSDYDYLLPEMTPNAIAMNTNKPYIFQTYTYSIENYKCFSYNLDCLCVDVTYNADITFDFKQFMKEYSEIVYELFLYSIYSRKKKINKSITIKKFREYATLGGEPNINNNAKNALDKLRNKVEKNLKEIDKANNNIDIKNDIKDLSFDMFEKFGITRNNVYLFINGHILFRCVVMPTMKKIVDNLIRNKRIKLENDISDIEERNTLRDAYLNMIYDPKIFLTFNIDFHECPLMDKIKQDVEFYLKRHPVNSTTKQ